MRIRWPIWLALTGAVGLHVLGGDPPVSPDVVPSVATPARTAPSLQRPSSSDSATAVRVDVPTLIDRRALYPARNGESRDLLAGAPPAPRATAPRSVATVAASAPNPIPALPYAFAGRRLDGASVQVFLTRGEKSFVAAVGDVIEGEYRVDAIGPAQVTFMHLASGTSQVMRAGETQ